MAPSAAFHFASQATGLPYAISAGGTVHATLDSSDGVQLAKWTVYGTDETSSGAWSLSSTTAIPDIVVTAPGSGKGKSMILECVINNDPDTAYRAKVYIAPEVMALGETNESSRTFGSLAIQNQAARVVLQSGNDAVVNANSGGAVKLQENGATVVAVSDESGVSTILGGGSGTRLASATNTPLLISVGTNGALLLQENTTTLLQIGSSGGKAFLSGQMSTGTDLMSNTGKLNLWSADGSAITRMWGTGAGLHLEECPYGTLQTTDATTTTIVSFAPTNGVVIVDAIVGCNNATNTSGGAFRVLAAFLVASGTPTIIGTSTVTVIARSDAAYTADVNASAGNIRVQVTGKAATNLKWEAYPTVRYVKAYS